MSDFEHDSVQEAADESVTPPLPTKFQVGQRVIVVQEMPWDDGGHKPETYNHLGYYGKVERIDRAKDSEVHLENLYWIRLLGRSGCEPAPWMMDEPWFNPFAFWEHQLEGAD